MLTIGSAAGPAILNFNLGTNGADRVDVLENVAVGAGGAVVNVNVLTTANPGVYPLITDSALSSGSYASLTLGTLSGNLGNNRFSLSQTGSGVNSTAENLVVQAAAATPSAAYWGGSQSTAWNTLNNPNTTANTNWLTAASGGTDTNQIPGATTDVYETANGGTSAPQTLGQSFSINSLTFNSLNGSGTTISDDVNHDTLSIAAAAGAYSAGTGIVVASGSGANTINAPLTLGGPQSWTNNSSNLLTIGGAVTNGGNLLTVAGSGHTAISGAINGGGGLTQNGPGTLTLSAANTYSGVTTVSGGTLQVSNTTGSATGSGNVNVNSGGLLTGSGAIVLGAGNAVTVASNGTIVGGTIAAPLTISGGNGLTLAAGSLSSFAPTTASASPLLSVNALFAPTGASTAR